MTREAVRWLLRWKLWADCHGQDMVEYALMAGFISVAAGATFPPVADQISTIFSKFGSIVDQAP